MNTKRVTNYVCKVTPEQAVELRNLLEIRGWDIQPLQYALFKASGDRANVAVYNSGKLVVQGAGTEDFVSFILEPEILHTFTFGLEAEQGSLSSAGLSEAIDPHGGIDESGKGDFFGPLCIACVYADAETGPQLRQLGCCDSKLVKSSKKILEMAGGIRRIVGKRLALVYLPPESYNQLYVKFGNLNRLLAWGHARAIENLLEIVPDCPRMLSDKFGNESLIRHALMTRGRKVKMDQWTKAESDIAVAAASILAREQFLLGMKTLGKAFGEEFPRGAGAPVLEFGSHFLQKHGMDAFARCAKLHFKTYKELVRTGSESEDEIL